MSAFVDTSAILAVLDADDGYHSDARVTWEQLLTRGERLTSTNYVVLEAFAVIQRRLGLAAARALQDDVLPVLAVFWVDEAIHEAGVARLFEQDRRQLSLVDCVSFELMRRFGLTRAFCFDRHFAQEGFDVTPSRVEP